jgi:hypothetical protein
VTAWPENLIARAWLRLTAVWFKGSAALGGAWLGWTLAGMMLDHRSDDENTRRRTLLAERLRRFALVRVITKETAHDTDARGVR